MRMRGLALLCSAILLTGCGSQSDSGQGGENTAEPFWIYPQAGQDRVLENSAFTTGYSDQHKGGLWSMYLLYGDQVAVTRERNDSFRADDRIPDDFQSTLNDYAGSGYDRGHLAPNASLDHTELSQRETFYLSNIVPQSPAFNRYQWSDVEQWLRDCSQEKMDNTPLLVITGSHYETDPEEIGDAVAVPESQYNVVLHRDSDHYLRAFAVLAHQESFNWDELADHIVSIDQLEAHTGVNFFSDLDDDLETVLEQEVRMVCILPEGVPVAPAIFYTQNDNR